MLNKYIITLILTISLLSCINNSAVDTEYVTIYFDKGRVFYNEVEVFNEDKLYIETNQNINLTCKYSGEDDKVVFENWEVRYKYTYEAEYYYHSNEDIKIKRLHNLDSITLNLQEYTYRDIRSTNDGNKLSFVSNQLQELYIFDLKNDTERTVTLNYENADDHWWLNSEELVVQFSYYAEKYNFTLNSWSSYEGIIKDYHDMEDPISGYYSDLKWNSDLSRYYYILNKESNDYICYYDHESQNVLWETVCEEIDRDNFEVTPGYNFYYLYRDNNSSNHVMYYDNTTDSVTTVMETTDDISFHKNYYNSELFYSIDDTDEFYLLKEDRTSELVYIGTECKDAIRLGENRYSFKENIEGYLSFRNITLLENGDLQVLK